MAAALAHLLFYNRTLLQNLLIDSARRPMQIDGLSLVDRATVPPPASAGPPATAWCSPLHLAILLAFALLLFRPQQWLAAVSRQIPGTPGLLMRVLIAAVGLWTGLIVLAPATYLLVTLVLVGRLPLVVFSLHSQVEWVSGIPLMLGSTLGGWLGASLALGPNVRVWIYQLLLSALSLEVVLMLSSLLRPR